MSDWTLVQGERGNPRTAEVTPWFPADTAPPKRGFYEVLRNNLGTGYPNHSILFYDGFRWRHTDHSCPGAPGCPALLLLGDNDRWRGLAEEWKEEEVPA